MRNKTNSVTKSWESFLKDTNKKYKNCISILPKPAVKADIQFSATVFFIFKCALPNWLVSVNNSADSNRRGKVKTGN